MKQTFLKKTLISLIMGISINGFAQDKAEGKALISPDTFFFPAYANVSFYKEHAPEQKFKFEADQMGIINYKLPLDSLEMKTQGNTTYLGLVSPSSKPDAEQFEPFQTSFKAGDSKFKIIQPLKYDVPTKVMYSPKK
jgi:hypothetical protein